MLFFLILSLSLLNPIGHAESQQNPIASVVDGDTLRLRNGEYVRLLQIDSPEIQEGECYSKEARLELIKLIKDGKQIRFETDEKLGLRDSYNRNLAYLFVDNRNVNIELVKRGVATPWAYNQQNGKYFDGLMAAAKVAIKYKRGLWKACPGTKLDVKYGVRTVPKNLNNQKCDPNYVQCLPVFPPDIDCAEVKSLGFRFVKIRQKDVHKLDRDGDGVGCD